MKNTQIMLESSLNFRDEFSGACIPKRMPRQFHAFIYKFYTKQKPEGGETDLFCELGRTPAVSAVASAVC